MNKYIHFYVNYYCNGKADINIKQQNYKLHYNKKCFMIKYIMYNIYLYFIYTQLFFFFSILGLVYQLILCIHDINKLQWKNNMFRKNILKQNMKFVIYSGTKWNINKSV